MQHQDLLEFKADVHSQNGEDGIIEALFSRIGTVTRVCCEFGAWDGIHLSNCRNLILEGWGAVMIEGDENRFRDLVANYASYPDVTCVNRWVGTGADSLDAILREHDAADLDFLSVDIDGLDSEVLEALEVRPRVICIEVNAGHDPGSAQRIDRETAADNIGQPLRVFRNVADAKGYDLVGYTGNAFLVRRDLVEEHSLRVLTAEQAYQQFLRYLPDEGKEWLYLVNLGIVNPRRRFHNRHLSRRALGIGVTRALRLRWKPPS